MHEQKKKICSELSQQMSTMSFICACLIVVIHSTPSLDVQTWKWWVVGLVGKEGLCRIAVPWFFLASGFFLASHFGEDGWYQQAIRKRTRSLLVPYFTWIIIGKMIALLAWWVTKLIGRECGFKYPFEGGFVYSLLTMIGINPFVNVGVVWYLRALFMLVVISPLIYWTIRKMGLVLPSVVFLCYGIYCTLVYFSNVWDYFFSIRGITYFILGVAIRLEKIRNVNKYFHYGICLSSIMGGYYWF